MQTILELLQSDNIQPIHIGKNEWHSPCPFCGTGTDRLSCWPDKANSNGAYMGGRFCCRRCGESGDAIAYLMKRRRLSFGQACRELDVTPGTRAEPMHKTKATWEPSPPKPSPVETWSAKAMDFSLSCQKELQQKPDVMQWLKSERGLEPEIIERFQLGWNAKDIYQERESWGLEPELSKHGKPKKLWLPGPGLVIPMTDEQGQVIRLRVRRAEPGTGSRYIVIPGSSMQPMTLWNQQGAVVVVESELDGILLHQECSDVIGVVSLGSSVMKPDSTLDSRLRNASCLLSCLDADDAGRESTWAFWQKHYPNCRRWPPLKKDVGDMHMAGIPIREWVMAGLPAREPEPEPEPVEPMPERVWPLMPMRYTQPLIEQAWLIHCLYLQLVAVNPDSESIEERLAIQIHDGRLTETQAELEALRKYEVIQ